MQGQEKWRAFAASQVPKGVAGQRALAARRSADASHGRKMVTSSRFMGEVLNGERIDQVGAALTVIPLHFRNSEGVVVIILEYDLDVLELSG